MHLLLDDLRHVGDAHFVIRGRRRGHFGGLFGDLRDNGLRGGGGIGLGLRAGGCGVGLSLPGQFIRVFLGEDAALDEALEQVDGEAGGGQHPGAAPASAGPELVGMLLAKREGSLPGRVPEVAGADLEGVLLASNEGSAGSGGTVCQCCCQPANGAMEVHWSGGICRGHGLGGIGIGCAESKAIPTAESRIGRWRGLSEVFMKL